MKYLSGLVHIPLKLSEIVGSSRVQLTFGIDTLQIVGMGMSPQNSLETFLKAMEVPGRYRSILLL